jgi:hypothetical protein
LGAEMKTVAFICIALLLVSAVVRGDQLTSLPPSEISAALLKAARIDSHPGLSVAELEAALGRYESVAAKGVFGARETLIYTLSNDRQLQVVLAGNAVSFAAVVPPHGPWELVWK